MEISLREFYEAEVAQKKFWASSREIILAENILAELSKSNSDSDKFLEVGIGDGFLLRQIRQLGLEVIGVDIAVKRCRVARINVPDAQIIVADARFLPFKSETFDIIVCSETLEHVPGYSKAISEARRVLKNFGRYIVTVPFRQKLHQVLCPHCLRSFYVDGHINSFDEKQLVQLFTSLGFEVQKIHGFGSQLFYDKNHFRFMRWIVDRILYKIFNSATYIMCIGIKK